MAIGQIVCCHFRCSDAGSEIAWLGVDGSNFYSNLRLASVSFFSCNSPSPISNDSPPPKSVISYYKGRSVLDSVCPLTPLPFTDQQMPNLAGRSGLGTEIMYLGKSIFMPGPLQSVGEVSQTLFVH